MAKKKTKDKFDRLAERIAADLLTMGGSGMDFEERADHLQAYNGERYLGGWCEAAIIRRIADHLRAFAKEEGN